MERKSGDVGDSHESLRWSSFSPRPMFVFATLTQIVFVCSTDAKFTEQKASSICFTSCHGTVLLWRHDPFFALKHGKDLINK